MALNPREGRWGLSRIVQESDGGWTTAALRDRLADLVECYYPPMLPDFSGYSLPFAVVRLEGNIGAPTADTRIIPPRLLTATLGDLTAAQRNTLRNQLQEWLTGYQFTDWDGAPITKAAFDAAGYTLDTPLRRVILDIFGHLGHSDSRPKPALAESHNTEYLDGFSTDPASRWTVGAGTMTWDSGNSEVDLSNGGDHWYYYSANDPGSIEHESQVTAQESSSTARCPYVATRGSVSADDLYGIFMNGDANYTLARWNAGARTNLGGGATTRNTSDWLTWRLAASGAAGANVVLEHWYVDHGGTKPSDPGWVGDDGSPDFTYTDTAANRLDDSTHISCGLAGRLNTNYGTRHSFWKSRAISDRSSGSQALEGAATGGASAAAALAVQKVLEAAAAAGATASAEIALGKPLAGAATGGGDGSADLSTSGSADLAGGAVAGATAAGALAVAIPLAGAAIGGAAAQAGLAHVVTLMGAGFSSSSAAGALSLGVPLAGAAIAGANATGEIVLGVTLQGAAVVGAAAAAALTVLGASSLAGDAIAGAQASATLRLDVRLAGNATGSGLAAANLSLAIPLSGAALAQAQATGLLTVTITLSGAAVSGAIADGALVASVALEGAAVAGATASAAFPDSALIPVERYTVTAAARRLALTAKARQYTHTARRRRLEILA